MTVACGGFFPQLTGSYTTRWDATGIAFMPQYVRLRSAWSVKVDKLSISFDPDPDDAGVFVAVGRNDRAMAARLRVAERNGIEFPVERSWRRFGAILGGARRCSSPPPFSRRQAGRSASGPGSRSPRPSSSMSRSRAEEPRGPSTIAQGRSKPTPKICALSDHRGANACTR